MGLDIGKLLRNVLSGGSTYFRDQRQAKKEEGRARDLIGQNTQTAEDLYNRDLGESQWGSQDMDEALSQLEDISREGFTDLDRQALNQAFMQSRREAQGQTQGALSAAARRGDAGGGNALMAALMSEQEGANRGAEFATNIGLAGRDRAFQGLQARSNLLGSQASGLDAWATGTAQLHGQDADRLMNARTGQSQSMQQHAQQLASTPNAEAAANAYLAYQTAGASGAAGAGGGVSNAVGGGKTTGTSGLPSSGTGDYQTGGGGGNKSMSGGAQRYTATRRRMPTTTGRTV